MTPCALLQSLPSLFPPLKVQCALLATLIPNPPCINKNVDFWLVFDSTYSEWQWLRSSCYPPICREIKLINCLPQALAIYGIESSALWI